MTIRNNLGTVQEKQGVEEIEQETKQVNKQKGGDVVSRRISIVV